MMTTITQCKVTKGKSEIKEINVLYWIMIGGSRQRLYREGGQYKDENGNVVPLAKARQQGFPIMTNTEYRKMIQDEIDAESKDYNLAEAFDPEYALYLDECRVDGD